MKNKNIENKIISEKQRKLIRNFKKIHKPELSHIKTNTVHCTTNTKSTLNLINYSAAQKTVQKYELKVAILLNYSLVNKIGSAVSIGKLAQFNAAANKSLIRFQVIIVELNNLV